MNNCKTIEISWQEFCAIQPIANVYDLYTQLRKDGVPHKFKCSSGQWLCWTKERGEFLPNCKGKLSNGRNI